MLTRLPLVDWCRPSGGADHALGVAPDPGGASFRCTATGKAEQMRTPMPSTPFLQRADHRDLLAAQALLQAMDPGWNVQTAAHSLARAAAGDRAALHRALARIQLRS